MQWVLITHVLTTRGCPRSTGGRHMSLTVFLLLSAVLAVAVGVLASLLLRLLMKARDRLEDRSQGRKRAAEVSPSAAHATPQIQTVEATIIREDH